MNHRGKDHFTVSSAGTSLQKQPHWAVSALPKADQSCSCPAWWSQRKRSEERVLKEGKAGLRVLQRRKKNSNRHQREAESSSLCRRVGIGVVGQGALRNCRCRKLMAGLCSGSRQMQWKMQWKMCPPCQHHQVGPGQEGRDPSPPSGDTTPAPLLGMQSSTDPIGPFPSEKHNSPQNLTQKKIWSLPESVQSLKPGRLQTPRPPL